MPLHIVYDKIIDTIEVTEQHCKHDNGFHAQGLSDGTYIMACNHRCGFYLRWNPDAAGKFRTEGWQEDIVLFREVSQLTEQTIYSSSLDTGKSQVIRVSKVKDHE